jgi:uncharacterized membrane protein YozB (DUF420 family)
MTERFFLAHIFFLVAFVGLLGALIVVLKRQRREWKPMILSILPLALIFVTAYLGKNLPVSHQVVNVFYDGLLIYNAYYFWQVAQLLAFWFYIFAIVATVLDFAMHFVIRMV